MSAIPDHGGGTGVASRRSAALLAVILLGGFLTLRGYRTRDGDQTFRLPLVLHAIDSRLYARDFFVQAFTRFNPLGGSARLIAWLSRPLGLSGAILALYLATAGGSLGGAFGLARRVHADPARPRAGPVAAAWAMLLLLAARAGNVGDNHLFEEMLLDRQMGLALTWPALAILVQPAPGRAATAAAAVLLGLATAVHPAVGLQAAALAAAWMTVRAALGRWTGDRPATALGFGVAAAAALAPTMLLCFGRPGVVRGPLSDHEALTISAYIQHPQHMIPHLWRAERWAGFLAYGGLAAMGLTALPPGGRSRPGAGRNLMVLIGQLAAGLAVATVAIEGFASVSITFLQPWRMATLGRGLMLVVIAGHLARLTRPAAGLQGWVRAGIIVAGLTSDGTMIVATLWELANVLADAAAKAPLHESGCEPARSPARPWPVSLALVGLLGVGLLVLVHRDRDAGGVRLAGGAALGLILGLGRRHRPGWGRLLHPDSMPLLGVGCGLAWVVPLAALLLPWAAWIDRPGVGPVARKVLKHWRCAAAPITDQERIGAWCRTHTPRDALFVVPPDARSFRLWSERAVVFNRATMPFDGAGMAEWRDRFMEHAGYRGNTDEFARLWLKRRHALERRYDRLGPRQVVGLANHHGAEYVLARAEAPLHGASELRLVRRVGDYCLYLVARGLATAPDPPPRAAGSEPGAVRSHPKPHRRPGPPSRTG